ncbi:MAG TPA: YebC/PmpR family DNA-binding transcriptional regulator [Candidatus Paceibacterota bacterium]
MSGHSKWSKIKRQKEVVDAKKGMVFGKFSRLITLESKRARGDVGAPGLRKIIERARAANMPTGNIERAVKKGLEKEAASLEEVLYEAYGPGGSAILIEGLTDNKNRTSAEIKHLLSKNGASIAPPGAASWAFEKKDEGWTPKTPITLSPNDAEKLHAILAGLEESDDVQAVYSSAE